MINILEYCNMEESHNTHNEQGESHSNKSETITLKKDTLWKVGTFVFAALFVISLFTAGFGFKDGGTTGQVVAPTNPSAPTPSKVQVSLDDDAVQGDKNAPVTIVEFSDYQCPFCGRFYSETLGQIEDNYVKTGKVKLVFRDFPLNSIHPQAQKAAEAAECAKEAGGNDEAYWNYHNKLFENQGALDVASLKKYAADLGLNAAKFNDCLDSGKKASEVAKDLADGQKYGVQGTPSFFINGQMISGAQPYSNFQSAIDAALAA